ncbi:hypothetical protein [Methylobacterium sp. NFXW15]|uniref:hypothetical protein n=1 Tax=Methylobacterium sp. NFXW15 TaxID=2819512 RepID=UPI003CF3B54E
MSALTRMLATSGWGSRCAFALAALAVVAVQALPEEDIAPVARVASATPVSGGQAEGAAVQRPLFDPARRAWTAQGSRDLIQRPDPAAPVLVVRGIRVDGRETRTFIDDGSGDRSWLAAGEGRGDWRIAAIAPDRVTVSQRGVSYQAEFLGAPATLRPAPFADAPVALRR